MQAIIQAVLSVRQRIIPPIHHFTRQHSLPVLKSCSSWHCGKAQYGSQRDDSAPRNASRSSHRVKITALVCPIFRRSPTGRPAPADGRFLRGRNSPGDRQTVGASVARAGRRTIMPTAMFPGLFQPYGCVILCIIVASAAEQTTLCKVTLAEQEDRTTSEEGADRRGPGSDQAADPADGAESESDDSMTVGFPADSWDRLSGAGSAKLGSLAQPSQRCAFTSLAPPARHRAFDAGAKTATCLREPRVASRPNRPHAPPSHA